MLNTLENIQKIRNGAIKVLKESVDNGRVTMDDFCKIFYNPVTKKYSIFDGMNFIPFLITKEEVKNYKELE